METFPTNTRKGFQLLLFSATLQFFACTVLSASTVDSHNYINVAMSIEHLPTTRLTKAPHSVQFLSNSTTRDPKRSKTIRPISQVSANADSDLPVSTHVAPATTLKEQNGPGNFKTDRAINQPSANASSYLSVTTHAELGLSEQTLSSNLSQQTQEFVLPLRWCFQGEKPRFSGTSFVLRGIVNEDDFEGTPDAGCRWTVHAPERHYLIGRVQLLHQECSEFDAITIRTTGWNGRYIALICFEKYILPPIFVESVLYLEAPYPKFVNFLFHFEATKEDVRQKLEVVFTSLTTGYVTPWNYDGVHQVICDVNASHLLVVPENHVVMVSFPRMDMDRLYSRCRRQRGLVLYAVQDNGNRSLVMTYCGTHVIPAHIFNTSLLIWFDTRYGNCDVTGTGFKMLFSFHPRSQSPLQLDNGLFQCWTPLYSSFRQHVHCNMERECEGGEDEGGHCPFSSPACKGMVASGHKCYQLTDWGTNLAWIAAKVHCQRLGGQLAMMKTVAEWNDFSKLYLLGKNVLRAFVGLTSADSYAPDVYKRSLFWVDGSVAQNMNVSHDVHLSLRAVSFNIEKKACFNVEFKGTLELAVKPYFESCGDSDNYRCFACQYDVRPVEQSNMTVAFPTIPFPWSNPRVTNISFFACRSGHVTHDFLSCDRETKCGRNDDLLFCPVQSTHRNAILGLTDDDVSVVDQSVTVAMFPCDDGRRVLPYSLVCDFREDCDDASDEAWCVHREQCAGFTCRNGQCVSHDQHCDMYKDCWDGSDEQCSTYKTVEIPVTYRYPPPVLIDFNSMGYLSQRRKSSLPVCNETHFTCSDGYCLPVYLFCNGVADCPGKEDEVDCRHHQCPGFYRCRSSSVCVHPDHLCDGWPQCPQRDDEWMCQAQCPSNCSCHGHAFVCSRPFPAPSFLYLRYLDASGSGMTLNDVSTNVYLTWLRLASCGILELPVMDLPNLRVLDLSENRLTNLRMDMLHKLQNLREIVLAGNFLFHIEKTHLFSKKHNHLQTLDLSRNRLRVFNSKAFANYPNIQTLNLSFNDIDVVHDDGFQFLPGIVNVDIRRNPLKTYPRDLLKESIHLRSIFSDDYRLCCHETLHATFDALGSCKAPEDKVSSCENLLKSESYRTLLWFVLTMICLGNVLFLSVRVLVRKTALSTAFNIILTNLNVADLLMGAYLLIVCAADAAYRGRYLSVEEEWRLSPTCIFAGFLAFLSFQVSLFLTFLLLLERLACLFPSVIQVKVDRHTAVVTSAVVWAVVLVIVAVTVLPMTSHWELYSQNGICAPLPTTDGDFPGAKYAFGVRTVLNMTLSIALALGQGFLFWSLRSGSVLDRTGSMEAEVARTRRVTTIIVTQIFSHLAIAVLGLMGYGNASGSIDNEVIVLAALMVVPLNAALNPYLFCAKMFFEKRRKRKKELLLERLKAQSLQTKTTSSLAN